MNRATPVTGSMGFSASGSESVFDSPLHQAVTATGANPIFDTA
jgi:hypothetical protein